MRFKLNDREVDVTPRPGESLLETLRERCGILSTKDGCEPQGQCGCCLALVDGRPLVTCAIPAMKAEGRSVVTLEGIPEEERELIARSFVAAAGLQCGFCIPGFLMAGASLLGECPQPSEEQIRLGLSGNLCRCTGYYPIAQAVRTAANPAAGGPT